MRAHDIMHKSVLNDLSQTRAISPLIYIKLAIIIIPTILLSGCIGGTSEFGPVQIPTILIQAAVIVGIVYFAWFRRK